uniref:Uncharacterized protein n=1 Tax=Chenopodium quinoa TaxID=63459 RepID=A0A803N0R7_CHEQI
MRGRRRGERNKLSDQTMSGANDRDADKGLLWKLPEIQTKDFGKIGPAFSFGAGCGFGFGLGVIGGALVDELVINTKKLMVAASKEMDKWRR